MSRGTKAAVSAAAVTLVVALGFGVAGSLRGGALLACLLSLGGLALALLVGRVRAALPPPTSFVLPPKRSQAPTGPLAQLESLERRLALAESSGANAHADLRPVVREIVAVRLSQRYGVDLDREPERAHVLLGEGLAWELARPDRRRPTDNRSPGLTRDQLEQLVAGLEQL